MSDDRQNEPWREDGTGTEQVDGTPTTCDAAFNRGYDAGYCAGEKAGAPPIRLPRWDQDPVVLRFGWDTFERCGNCGERNAKALAIIARVRALADEWRNGAEVSEWNPLAELEAALDVPVVSDETKLREHCCLWCGPHSEDPEQHHRYYHLPVASAQAQVPIPRSRRSS